MTIPYADGTGTPAAVPPPQCPAHAHGLDGRQRLYGPEADAPYALYERMRREHGQVAPVLLPGDVPAWFVLGHRENLDVMRSPSLWSCDSRIWNVKLAADSPLLPITAWQPLLVFADDPEHARLRAAVTESLGKFNRHGIRRYVVRHTQQLVDSFSRTGRADLVTDFAEKLSVLVLARQMGVRDEDALPLGTAVRNMVKGTETALQSNEYVVSLMSDLVERKKAAPGDDLASWLLAHESELSDQEVMEHLRHAIVAAHENTTNLMANTLRTVMTDRRFRASLSGGSLTLPDALDQVMWDAPPMSVGAFRWARRDTKLGDQVIRAGDMVMLGLAAGNVDPEIRPDLNAPVHGNRSHLAFSAGPHECPGQDIGRAIADTGIDTLLARLPDIELAVSEAELDFTSSLVSTRLNSLPARFTPRRGGVAEAPEPSAPAKAQPLPTAVAPARPPMPVAADVAPPRAAWWQRFLGIRTR
ncbi:cytochrome P450 [Streptomyces sp. NPDC054847]|uniref:cytochrome P450 n=1 Tax=Streptomyces sp. OZ13 TaxID=3452210 RepID=UPI003F8CA790